MHPELVIPPRAALSEAEKQAIAARCLELAIAGETYEYTTMYPTFAEQARADCDRTAAAEFEAQQQESKEHADQFRKAAHNFGLLVPIEHFHADRYTDALNALDGQAAMPRQVSTVPATQKWICQKCSMIYDPVLGDPDSGIAPGTLFEDIPDDWACPICGAIKRSFVPYAEPVAA